MGWALPLTAGTGCRVAGRSVWWYWSGRIFRLLLMERVWNSPPWSSEETSKCKETLTTMKTDDFLNLNLYNVTKRRFYTGRVSLLPGESWRRWRCWTRSALRSQLEDNCCETSPSLWPDRRSPSPRSPAGFKPTLITLKCKKEKESCCSSLNERTCKYHQCDDEEPRRLTRDGNMMTLMIFPNGSASFLRYVSSTDWDGNLMHTTFPFSKVWQETNTKTFSWFRRG